MARGIQYPPIPSVPIPGWNLGNPAETDGNIPVSIDFRDVYAGLLEQHLGIEAARILPGYAGSPLQVLA